MEEKSRKETKMFNAGWIALVLIAGYSSTVFAQCENPGALSKKERLRKCTLTQRRAFNEQEEARQKEMERAEKARRAASGTGGTSSREDEIRNGGRSNTSNASPENAITPLKSPAPVEEAPLAGNSCEQDNSCKQQASNEPQVTDNKAEIANAIKQLVFRTQENLNASNIQRAVARAIVRRFESDQSYLDAIASMYDKQNLTPQKAAFRYSLAMNVLCERVKREKELNDYDHDENAKTASNSLKRGKQS